MEGDRAPYSLFFYTSPYKRSKQTHEEICSAFDSKHLVGNQEEVQLREQVCYLLLSLETHLIMITNDIEQLAKAAFSGRRTRKCEVHMLPLLLTCKLDAARA